MTLRPDIAKRAQEEIDKVLGNESRLPTLEDRDDLPYIDCILKETYRWGIWFILSVITADFKNRVNSPLPLGTRNYYIIFTILTVLYTPYFVQVSHINP